MNTEDDKHEKLVENLAKLFVHVTDSAFEKASHRAVLICFALKYLLSIGMYIVLRNFAFAGLDELWIAIVLAYSLYGHEMFINMKVKEGMVKSILAEHCNEEKDIEDSSCPENSCKEEKD